MKIDGADMERNKANVNMTKIYGMQAVLSLITAYALALIVGGMGVVGISEAIMLGLVVSLGFMATLHYQNVLYGNNSQKLWLINAGYSVVGTVIISLILTIWQ